MPSCVILLEQHQTPPCTGGTQNIWHAVALNLTHVSRLLYLHYVSVRQQDLHSTELSHYVSRPLWLLSLTSKTYTPSIYSKSWVPCVFKVHCCIQSDLTLRLGLIHTL